MQKSPDVIVFRPEPKASILVEDLLSQKNISAIVLEPFKIIYLQFLPNGKNYDDIIFTSTYAVSSFFDQVDNVTAVTIMNDTNVWAIGSATAKVLNKYGFESNFPIKANSESLFNMLIKLNRSLENRNFLLVKGKGGNQLLTERLNEKSLNFETINCYYRMPYSIENLLKQLYLVQWNKRPKVLLYTSFDALKITLPVFKFFPEWKKFCIVTVTNIRMLEWARFQGFLNLYLLDDLSHISLLKAVGNLCCINKGLY